MINKIGWQETNDKNRNKSSIHCWLCVTVKCILKINNVFCLYLVHFLHIFFFFFSWHDLMFSPICSSNYNYTLGKLSFKWQKISLSSKDRQAKLQMRCESSPPSFASPEQRRVREDGVTPGITGSPAAPFPKNAVALRTSDHLTNCFLVYWFAATLEINN